MKERKVDVAGCVGWKVGSEGLGARVDAFAVEGGEGRQGGDEDAEIGEGDEEGEPVHGLLNSDHMLGVRRVV